MPRAGGGGRDGAGEDAVAGFLVGVELGAGDVDGGLGAEFGFVDAVEGEAAQGRLSWVPSVEAPVVFVVDQALWGHLALAFLLGGAGLVGEAQLAAFQDRFGDDAEDGLVAVARLGAQYAQAVQAAGFVAEDLLDAPL